jgi:hypothetical protein
MTHDIRANLEDLLRGTVEGRLMEVFERHYHEDVVVSDNGGVDPGRVGKANNRLHQAFLAEHVIWHDARVGNVAVDGDQSAYELYFDVTLHGRRVQRTEVAVQRWRDGQIVHESLYYKV